MTEVVVRVDALAKTFRKPFTRRAIAAVKEVSFEVRKGEIFGFLGPNGAGKTTTLKMLTGLIRPTSGSASLLGEPIPSPQAMGRVGFLPENPYIYPYLTPREFVTLAATLCDIPGKGRDERVEAILSRVGMSEAIDRPAHALSKGMLQRVGFAAALVHEPELLILDEPMSGLDPVGRKDIRDLILEERKLGRTVLFSSHILSDVELLCDRVCILKSGQVVVAGRLDELLAQGSKRSEVALLNVSSSLRDALSKIANASHQTQRTTVFDVEGEDAIQRVVTLALSSGAVVEAVTPKRETLEDLFVRKAL